MEAILIGGYTSANPRWGSGFSYSGQCFEGWFNPEPNAWRHSLSLQADLGVPSQYYAAPIDSTHEPLEAEDYRLIRDIWQDHRQRLGGQGKGYAIP